VEIYRGMVNLPSTWHGALGPLGRALQWLGVRFDGPAPANDEIYLVLWFVAWLGFMWFLPNTQQLLARWHPAYNYGMVERQRDLPLPERIPSFTLMMQWRPNIAGAVFVGVLAALACLSLRHISEFLYFRY
jgi:hypothetical protein